MQISLRAARVNAKLSLAKAAEKLGKSEVTIRNYENGKTFPDLAMCKLIEEVYEIPIENIKIDERK